MRGSSISHRKYLFCNTRKTQAVAAPNTRCPMSEGRSAEAASVLQSQTPVSSKGNSVIGPKYHQIRPNSHPQATPALRFADSLRNSNPNVIPIAVLTRRCTNNPCQLLKLVSNPATFVSTPVFSMMGLET